ncbi:hypothetical protein DYB25_005216 [Aphanomyces astaci]|uniref:Uncharacterized protein n=1 Tax=Aphanomyces astaci TaxID=112090 RepID=A0A397A5X0_APHAT|nr:hypothetical protein DYB36_007657 [Aphanomyces astaci]RHY12395.1 hypothetical protein DYB25_005216 [Aphanomyces astaci]RHY53208.1 hypothetical protein DYB38_002381 [Aphanomyces astaci]RHY98650.1 hypothetical protein DYB26_010954 [Aphanomyces astaci]RHZ07858.1 hypothetical protein DYB31_005172 [Aphanomyces astaci]
MATVDDDDTAAFLVSALCRQDPTPQGHSQRERLSSATASSDEPIKHEDEEDDPNDAMFFHNLDLAFAADLNLSNLPPPAEGCGPLSPLQLHPPPPQQPPPPLPPESHRFHLRLTTRFLPRYWKNGRKNLQCFPFCPEHGDFHDMKLQGKKHASIGVCRTPVHCDLHSPLWLPHVHVIGRIEQISPGVPMETPPLLRGLGEWHAFRHDGYDASQLGTSTSVPGGGCKSTWMFLPDVWKLQPLLRKKRKATRSTPAETFPFYFRVFCFLQSPTAEYLDPHNCHAPIDTFRCVAECHSTSFELSSTRTVDRHRKAKSSE